MYSTDLLYKELPHHANGGHIPRTTMQEVHLNPEEVEHFDQLQGGPQFTATGRRSYKKLGHGLFKNANVVNAFQQHAAEHHARGGLVGRHMHPSAANGRYGDTEMVEMPHNLVHELDKAIGGPVRNPWDGKPEYFLGGLMSSFGRIFSKIAPALGRGAAAVGRGAAKLGRGAVTAARAAAPTIGKGLKGAAQAATAILPTYMQYKMSQQPTQTLSPAMEEPADDIPLPPPTPPRRPRPVEPLPDDLYGQFAGSQAYNAAKRLEQKSQ